MREQEEHTVPRLSLTTEAHCQSARSIHWLEQNVHTVECKSSRIAVSCIRLVSIESIQRDYVC